MVHSGLSLLLFRCLFTFSYYQALCLQYDANFFAAQLLLFLSWCCQAL